MPQWLACQKDNELGKTMVTRLTRSTLTRVSSQVTKLYFHLESCYSASVDTFMFCLSLVRPSQSERVRRVPCPTWILEGFQPVSLPFAQPFCLYRRVKRQVVLNEFSDKNTSWPDFTVGMETRRHWRKTPPVFSVKTANHVKFLYNAEVYIPCVLMKLTMFSGRK